MGAGGARFLLWLHRPLPLRIHQARFRLRGQLGDQVLLTLLGPGLDSFFLLLHFLAQPGFQLTQGSLGLRASPTDNFLGLVIERRLDTVQLGLPFLVS